MRTEAYVFTGVAVFFGVDAVVYAWFSREPAGVAALAVSCLMSALIAFFCRRQYVRLGSRPQDRVDVPVAEGAGTLGTFPARSFAPVLTALGAVVAAAGIVYGLWLLLVGVGVLAAGVAGFVFDGPAGTP